MSNPLPVLDPVLHQPVRTQIVAFLASRGEATFSELKRALNITDGNLGAHLNKLQEATFIATREVSTGSRPQTVFTLTESGAAALADYVAQLSSLLPLGVTQAVTAESTAFSLHSNTQEIL